MADDMLVVRIVVPHEDMMTKAMRFSASKTIREVLFETAQNLCNSGIEIPDVINFNFKYEPGKKKINKENVFPQTIYCRGPNYSTKESKKKP